MPADANKLTRLQWNHRAHEEWAKERLHFFRLGFAPTYPKNAVLAGIKAAIASHGIHSYVIYELAGLHDIMLRVWLPTDETHERFEQTLQQELRGANLQILDVFIVSRILLHWVWSELGSTNLRVPDDEALKRGLSDAEIRKINDAKLKPDELQPYKSKNIVEEANPGEGIRFFVAIPESGQATPRQAQDKMRSRLLNILSSANNLSEVSLYQGHGFAQILILARVPF